MGTWDTLVSVWESGEEEGRWGGGEDVGVLFHCVLFVNAEHCDKKVFRKLGYNATPELITAIVGCKPGHVEYLLYELRKKIEQYQTSRLRFRDTPSITPHPDDPSSQQSVPQLPQPSTAISGVPSTYSQQQQQLVPAAPPGGGEVPSGGNAVPGKVKKSAEAGRGGFSGGGGGVVGGVGVKGGGTDGREMMIKELQETIQILQLKVVKLEQLLVLKDKRIDGLSSSLLQLQQLQQQQQHLQEHG
ncbi:hypothetical protein HDU67_009728 [Dinochytrium kinnereticum]|nr:hypothetical protein HDU67_009728 [Dinochytrium kinnereticum]